MSQTATGALAAAAVWVCWGAYGPSGLLLAGLDTAGAALCAAMLLLRLGLTTAARDREAHRAAAALTLTHVPATAALGPLGPTLLARLGVAAGSDLARRVDQLAALGVCERLLDLVAVAAAADVHPDQL